MSIGFFVGRLRFKHFSFIGFLLLIMSFLTFTSASYAKKHYAKLNLDFQVRLFEGEYN